MIRILLLLGFLLLAVVTGEQRCADTDRRCPDWQLRGNCLKDEDLRRRCPESCGLCRTEDENEILRNMHHSTKHTLFFMYALVAFIMVAIVIGIVKIRNTGGVCRSKGNMKGKLVVITGGTSGIGLDTAYHLALRGAKVIIGCRSIKNGLKIAKDLRVQTGQQLIEIRKLDLTSFESIREFASLITEQFPNVNVLINNAGIHSGKKRSVTADGHESTFQTNYLGHFYLTKLLMSKLKESAPSRIINVVSEEFCKGELDFKNLQGNKNFDYKQSYHNANLAIMYFTKELNTFLKGTGVTVNAANPGSSSTNLWRDVFPYGWNLTWLIASPYTYMYWKTPSMGAETSYYCALDRDLEEVSGSYFKDCKEEPFPELDDEVGRKLWAVSERLLEPKKVSTLNQAAIKKALNEIAEAELAEESGETSEASKNTATEDTDDEILNVEADVVNKKTTSKVENPTVSNGSKKGLKKKTGDVRKKTDKTKKESDSVKKDVVDGKKKTGGDKKKTDDVTNDDDSDVKNQDRKKPVEQEEKSSKVLKADSTTVRNRKIKKKTPPKKD